MLGELDVPLILGPWSVLLESLDSQSTFWWSVWQLSPRIVKGPLSKISAISITGSSLKGARGCKSNIPTPWSHSILHSSVADNRRTQWVRRGYLEIAHANNRIIVTTAGCRDIIFTLDENRFAGGERLRAASNTHLDASQKWSIARARNLFVTWTHKKPWT